MRSTNHRRLPMISWLRRNFQNFLSAIAVSGSIHYPLGSSTDVLAPWTTKFWWSFHKKGLTYRRPLADHLHNCGSDFHCSSPTTDEHVEIFPQFSSDWLPSGGLQLRWSDVSARLQTKSSNNPIIPILREVFQNSLVMHRFLLISAGKKATCLH